MSETKQEKFDRMLEARLPKALKAIELLGNLARKSDYEWHGKQVDDMLDQIEEKVDEVMDRFGVPRGDEEVSPVDAEEMPRPPAYLSHDDWAPPPDLDDNRPFTQKAGVDGYDRRDIRAALETLTKMHGPSDPGVAALRKVVLGWAPAEWD